MSRKIILNLCTSLDAYIEGENAEIDWCFTDQDYEMTSFLNRIDTIFIGRKSYDQLMEMMPDAFPGKTKIVFSHSLKNKECKDQVISDAFDEEVKTILQQSGKDIWLFGGASLTTAFINANLVDELMISIHPLILGGGKSLFSEITERKNLTHTDTKTFETGLVQLYYKIEK